MCCPTTDWLYAYVDGDRIPVPPTKLLDRGPLPKHPYANDCRRGMVAPGFDHVVGELMNALEKHGLAGNTLVVVTSDNGPEVPTIIAMRHDHKHDGARPWRGVKRDNWEGGHRVPMIARWPGKVKAGSVTGQTVCLTDIMATCAAIAGADLPNDAAEDSFDVLPVLLGKQDEDDPVRHACGRTGDFSRRPC